MRYSSHLYIRTDGTLGRFPIIEVDSKGVIVSILECGDTLSEMSSTRFFSGVIIPHIASFGFSSQQDFVNQCLSQMKANNSYLTVGAQAHLMLVDSFDLNTFDGSNARFRPL